MSDLVCDGKVYIIRIKPTMNKDWEEDDLVYAVAHEGGAGLAYSAFKHICEKLNNKWFVSKKANSRGNDSSCSWDNIAAAMNSFPATGQQQLTLTTSAVSFLELASQAYQVDIFTDKEGQDVITKLMKEKSSKQPRSDDPMSGPYNNPAAMIAKAKKDAESFNRGIGEIDTSSFSQAELLLTYPGLSGKSEEELKRLVMDLQTKLVSASEQIEELTNGAAAKDEALTQSETKITELTAQLKEVKADTVGFMCAADKASIGNKILVDGLAAEVVKGLKPFITSQIKTIQSPPDARLSELLGDVSKKVEQINTNIVDAAKNVKIHSDSLRAVIDTQHEATNETIEDVVHALDGVGITNEARGVNIIDTLVSLSAGKAVESSKQQQLPPAPTTTKHSGLCSWQSSESQPNILICKLGCGSQLSVPAPPVQSQATKASPGKNLSSTSVQYPPNNNTAGGYMFVQGLTQDNNEYNNNNGKKKRKWQNNWQNNWQSNWQSNFAAGKQRIMNKQAFHTGVPTQQHFGPQVQQYQGMPYMNTGNVQYSAYPQQQPSATPPNQGGNMVHGQVFHGNTGPHGPN